MIERIKELAEIVGGVKRFARHLGIKHQSLYSWRDIPPARVLDVERITGVSRHELRPDVFGPTPTNGAPAQRPVSVEHEALAAMHVPQAPFTPTNRQEVE